MVSHMVFVPQEQTSVKYNNLQNTCSVYVSHEGARPTMTGSGSACVPMVTIFLASFSFECVHNNVKWLILYSHITQGPRQELTGLWLKVQSEIQVPKCVKPKGGGGLPGNI